MLVLSALIVPCGLLVLMMAMQQVQERLLPPGGPVPTTGETAPTTAAAVATPEARTPVPPMPEPVMPAPDLVIPTQPTYEPSDSDVGSASLTSASPSR